MATTFYRWSAKFTGVAQRCTVGVCPPEAKAYRPCPKHRWTFRLEVPTLSGTPKQGGPSQFGWPRGTTFDGAAEAHKARLEAQHRHSTAQLPVDASKTVGAWLDEWLDLRNRRGALAPSTARNYADAIKNHLKPRLGAVRLGDLRGPVVTRAYLEMVEERRDQIAAAEAQNERLVDEAEAVNALKRQQRVAGRRRKPRRVPVPRSLGWDTFTRIHSCLVTALATAVKYGMIHRNWAQDAELPVGRDAVKVIPPEPEQYGRLLDQLKNHRLLAVVVAAGYGGLRRGELCGLQWSDIDLSTGRTVIRRQRVSVGYEVIERQVKTQAGQQRVIYFDDDALADLRAWRRMQAAERLQWGEAYHGGDYVFTWENGQAYHPDYIGKTVAKLMKAAGIVGGHLHQLRHFRASWLIAKGADMLTVSRVMGHTDIRTTMNIYGHMFEDAQRKAAKNAAGFVPRATTTASKRRNAA